MIPPLDLELVLIQTMMIVKNYIFAKEAGSKDKNKCAYQIKIILGFYHDCTALHVMCIL